LRMLPGPSFSLPLKLLVSSWLFNKLSIIFFDY
jgi:hypothetical protein